MLNNEDIRKITNGIVAGVLAGLKKSTTVGVTPDFTVTSGPDADGAVTIAAFDAIPGHGKLIYPGMLVDPQFNLTDRQVKTIRANCGCTAKGFLDDSYNAANVFGPVPEKASNGQTQGFLGKCIPLVWDPKLGDSGDYNFDKDGYMPGVIGLRFETLIGAYNAALSLAG